MEYRIATLAEVAKQFDWLIETHSDNEANKKQWSKWKTQFLHGVKCGLTIPYYGFEGDTCICEAYANITKNNDFILAKRDRPYLQAFRTRKPYQGQHYFTGLFNYMINDLKAKGYNKVCVGVESTETKNKAMYDHYGFKTFLFSMPETYHDGTKHIVEYYEKQI